MSELLLITIKGLNKAMRDKDADENKLKQDQKNRENAKKAVEEAKVKTSDIKAQIFDQAKVKEAEFKK